jgi:inorganic pyrophosphatase
MTTVMAMVECPRGINHKLDFDAREKRFTLSKILPAGLTFPFDFGFITDTKGEDGDPLDIVIISEITGFPGCMIECRVIGVLAAEQTERDGKTVRNDRYLGIPVVSQLYSEIKELAQLPEAVLNELEEFFKNYNKQAGKKFRVIERLDAKKAYLIMEKARP